MWLRFHAGGSDILCLATIGIFRAYYFLLFYIGVRYVFLEKACR